MLGVFDSGMGGRYALAALRECLPHADILFLADTAHAPYGTKDEATLCRLITEDICRLRHAGAERILCACCTASCVLPQLPEQTRRGVYPILHPTAACAARTTRTHRFCLLATDATVKSGALGTAVSACDKQARILSRPAPELVRLSELGRCDPDDVAVREALLPHIAGARVFGADTLILGCTHFSAFRPALSHLAPDIRLVDSATEGAHAFAQMAQSGGSGITEYL